MKILLILTLGITGLFGQWANIASSDTPAASLGQLNLKMASRAAAGAPGGACQAGPDFYVNTSNNQIYWCPAGTWVGILPNANTTATSANTASAIVARDASGNFSAGAITAASFSTTGSGAGTLELTQGTAPTAGTTSVKLYAHSAVTSYIMRLPSAAGTGFVFGTNTSGDVVQTFVAANGSGNVLLSAGTAAIASGKTLTVSNTMTQTATDSSTVAFGAGGTVTYTIASGTKALDTDAIASGACDTLATTTATGVASTDRIDLTFNADPTAVTGYAPVTTGGLQVIVWPTTNTLNWKVCNPTASSITPGAITLNYGVTR